MTETKASAPQEKRATAWQALQRFADRLRPLVDFWPLLTTCLVLSGAIGVHFYFCSLGIASQDILTIEEYTVQSIFGLIYLIFFVAFVSVFVALVALFAFQLQAAFLPRFDEAMSRLISDKVDWLYLALSMLFLTSLLEVFASFAITDNTLTIEGAVAAGSVAVYLLLVRVLLNSAVTNVAWFLFVLTLVAAPGTGVYLALLQARESSTIAWADGHRVCPSSATLFWHGEKVIVLRCKGRLLLIDHPDNIVVETE